MNRKNIFDYLFFRRSSWASWNLKNAKTNNAQQIANIKDPSINQR